MERAARKCDVEEYLQIKKAVLSTFLELAATEKLQYVPKPFRFRLITLLGRFGDGECVDALLREQAKRPISSYHSTIAYALRPAAEHGEPSDRRRIRAAWLQAWGRAEAVEVAT